MQKYVVIVGPLALLTRSLPIAPELGRHPTYLYHHLAVAGIFNVFLPHLLP